MRFLSREDREARGIRRARPVAEATVSRSGQAAGPVMVIRSAQAPVTSGARVAGERVLRGSLEEPTAALANVSDRATAVGEIPAIPVVAGANSPIVAAIRSWTVGSGEFQISLPPGPFCSCPSNTRVARTLLGPRGEPDKARLTCYTELQIAL